MGVKEQYLSRHILTVMSPAGWIMSVVAIPAGYAEGWAMLSINVWDKTNLSGKQKEIIKAAEKGVNAATQDTVEWIKNDVITGGKYVGHQDYPDVKPVTKRMKAKKGQTMVLVGETKNYLGSWDGKAKGLTGTITGGGLDYHAKLHAKGWKIDKLWENVHKKVSEKIVKDAVEKAV